MNLRVSLFLLVFCHSDFSVSKRTLKKAKKASGYLPVSSSKDQEEVITEAQYWCYHCASPRKYENHEMLAAMDQLLTFRGSFYPYEAINENCHYVTNSTAQSMQLTRQSCRYPYCHKITFDDGEGPPLTIRGCSEKLMASNEKSFCKKVHNQLQIRECSCQTNGICNSSKSTTVCLARASKGLPMVFGAILLLYVLV